MPAMSSSTANHSAWALGLAMSACLAAAGLGFPGPSPTPAGVRALLEDSATSEPAYAPGELLVRFRRGVPDSWKQGAHAALGVRVTARYDLVEGLEQVTLPAGMNVPEAMEFYRRQPEVLYAEPNYVVRPLLEPNDPNYASQWALPKIHAPEAWELSTGSSEVVVAVLDTGIDYKHEDLAANMWRNAADCDRDGVDDDGNGYKDDCYGIDVWNHDTNPMDGNGHGTMVAGIIGAAGNNGLGVAGVNWTVRLLACRFIGQYGLTSGAIKCLEYVARMRDRGVNLVAVNASWGGSGFSQALEDAIDALRPRGILFVAGAGNDNTDNDLTPVYPAGFYLPHLLAAAATNGADYKWSPSGICIPGNCSDAGSNYGRRTVHLGAPGVGIMSTAWPDNGYQTGTGTSAAAPFVTGVVALLKASDPSLDWKALRNLILAGGDPTPNFRSTVTGKRLNAYGAMACSSSAVFSRLRPVRDAGQGQTGTPVELAALNINCAAPGGEVVVLVEPGGGTATLVDDGVAPDPEADDGIYSALWTPPAAGLYTLTFPDGDAATVYFSAFTGVVRDGDGDPQRGATVAAYQAGELRFSTTTASDGTYTLPVAAGVYDLEATHWEAVPDTRAGMTAGTEEVVENTDFRVQHPATLSGTAWDRPSTTRLPGVLIEAIRPDGSVSAATTNDNGYYTLQVMPGRYKLRASKSGYKTFVYKRRLKADDPGYCCGWYTWDPYLTPQ